MLDALLYVVQHVCCKLKQFLPLVLLAVDFYRGRIVGQAGHFKGAERRSRVSATTKAFVLQLQNAVLLLVLARVFTVILMDAHQ